MTKGKWLRGALIAGVVLFAASIGFSRSLRASAARRYLIARLAASFGRPVEVSWFDFSLLDGARIEAHFVTVSEDQDFGNEYFLRADALTAGLRWSALAAGRIEFDSVSLLRPSLNLARNTEGHWNIERWLPPGPQSGSSPGFVETTPSPSHVRAARLHRIDVDGGRINFKRGSDKSAFALVGVSGRIEQNGEGRWELDVEARPMRAGVELQDIGTLRLQGSIAGTTARLQPAELHLTWRAASLADTLRLIRQDDYGMRGQLEVDLNAKVATPEAPSARDSDSRSAQWSLSGAARLSGIHGWRLPSRSLDPAVNLSVEAHWRLGEAHAEIRKLLVEMPDTHLQGAGDLNWTHGIDPQVHIESSTIGLGDLLSWYRAVHPGVADDLKVEGVLGVDLAVGGSPIQLQNGAIASTRLMLTSRSLPGPLQIGAINASVSRGGLDFAPTEIFFAPAAPVVLRAESAAARESISPFIVRGSISPAANGVSRWPPDWNLSIEGSTSRVQDWLVLSEALGQPQSSGWAAAGGLAVKLRGARRSESPGPVWIGTADFLGLTVSPDYVNQPVRLPRARVEFAPQQRTITFSAAEALGATWRGTISRKNSDQQWVFDLSADRLDAAELDRWLGPRARPGFLARLTSFGSPPAPPQIDALVAKLAARGRLRVGEIEIAPIHIEQLDSEAEIAGRTIQIRKVQADFFGGKVSGSLSANLLHDPSYDFQGSFERINLALLGRAVPFLTDRISGIASATLALSAHGVGRDDLIGSMQGQGTLKARNAEIRGLVLSGVFPGADPDPGSTAFSSIQGAYRIRAQGIDLSDFTLDHARGRLLAEGRIEFSHALNVQVHPWSLQPAAALGDASAPGFLLSGTVENPKWVLPSAAALAAARPGARQR
jgi:hypothetical protein